MKTSLRVLRCRLLSVFAFLALASSAQELHLGRGPVAMATGSPAPDWHREGSSGGEWSHNASAADVADRPAATGSSPENRTFAGLPPTETAGTVTLPPGRPNATDSDLAEARSATAAPDRRGSAQYTAWTDDGRVPPATHDPRGANGSSSPAPDSTPSSRVAVCLSRMDVVWIVLAVGVPVSTCSVLLTVCCMRRRKKSSGQESNLSYWNNAITMDYFSRHAVELPREIHTLESEEHDSCLPPNGEYGAGSVVLVNPFCQESLFINRDKAAAT